MKTLLRTLFKAPAFTVLAILTLGAGIGLNTAIFSVANAVLFHALPYRDPGRLVVALFGGDNPVSPTDYLEWKEQSTAFAALSAAEYWTPNLTGQDEPEQLWAVRTTDNLFDMLGVPALVGRTYTEADETPKGAAVVVISHRLWTRRFGADTTVINRMLTLDGRAYQIIGVMPEGFEFPLFWATRAELWAPLPLGDRRESMARSLRAFARLKPDRTIQQAQTELDGLMNRIAEKRPEIRSEPPVQVLPLYEKVVTNVRPILLLLLIIVMLVLLIACANIANLLLARGTARRRELAVRTALGATRPRLLRQLIAENGAIACFGGAVGLMLGFWGLKVLTSMLPADLLPRQGTIAVNSSVLVFVALLSFAATLLFGVLPAFHASRADINDALKETMRSTGTRETHWRRRLIVIGEIAISLVLLVAAGLLLRSLIKLQALDPGFSTGQITTMTVSVAGTNQSPAPKRQMFYQDVLDSVSTLPGVASASMINHLPLAGDVWARAFSVEGRAVARPEDQPAATYRVVTPGYFQTMQIRLRGRDFTNLDRGGAPAVVIVNEAMVQRYFADQDPIGKHIKLGGTSSQSPWMTIVGVAPSVKQSDWTAHVRSEVYVPLLQSPGFLSDPAAHYSYMTLVVRSGADASGLTSAIRARIQALERNAPVSQIATMAEIVAQKLSRPRIATILSGTFAVVGLFLAAIGIYGVISYHVNLRTQEIGLRTALGASPRDVIRMVLREGLLLAGSGACVGTLVSWVVSRAMETLLFEVTPMDPLTLGSVALIIALVAVAACYFPVRRAIAIDPIVALRNE